MTYKEYKDWMIDELLKRKNINCTRDELERYSIRRIEGLFDNVD